MTNYKGDRHMSIRDLLGDFKPTTNAEDSFDPLKGKYEVVIDKLEVGKNKDGVFDRYKMTLKVTKTISGDKGDNRLFFKTYMKDNAEKVKDLICDLFTMGVNLNTAVDTDEDFEAQFSFAVGAKGHVSAYHFKPEKDMQGNVIPEGDRKPVQISKVYKPGEKADKATADLPF